MPVRVGPIDYAGQAPFAPLETISDPPSAWEKYDNLPSFISRGGPFIAASQNNAWNAIVWAPSHTLFPNDQWASAGREIAGTFALGRRVGPAIQMEPNRATAGGNAKCYMASIDDDNVILHHLTGTGQQQQLKLDAGSNASDAFTRIELQGTILKVYVDDVLRITFDHGESTLQGGQPGLATGNSSELTGQFQDSWTAGDFLKEGPGPGVGRRTLVDTSPITGRRITESRRIIAPTRVPYDRSIR